MSDKKSNIYIGIDLGGTNIKLGCFNEQLKLLGKLSAPTQADMGPDAVVTRICENIERVLKKTNLSLNDIAAVGLGTPGPVKLDKGIIVAAPNLPMFKNTPMRDMLSAKLGKSVVMENDANAACWGEYVAGAGRGADDMIFFTLGTGIGGGIITNGQIVHGFADDAAELGHIIIYPGGRRCGCGQNGCAEAYASASSTARRATEAIGAGAESTLKKLLYEKAALSCKDVFDHAGQGDELATEIVEKTAEVLAILCIDMLHTTGPRRILFAGGMIAAGDILLKRVRHYFDEYIWPMKEENIEIRFASLGEDAGIIGTAALAQQK